VWRCAQSPHTIFRRALERGNLPAAEAATRELPRVSLADALDLTLLIARREPHRHPLVAARWLRRYLEEQERDDRRGRDSRGLPCRSHWR
jgi:hypothetical protein